MMQPPTLSSLRTQAMARKNQLLQSTQLSNPPNTPTWGSVVTASNGIQVTLVAPKTDANTAYPQQGAGVTYPKDAAQSSPVIFFYQVQSAAAVTFANPKTYDEGAAANFFIGIAGTFYLRARARISNGQWSQWRPYGAAVTV